MTSPLSAKTRDHTFTYPWARSGRPTSWESRDDLIDERGGHFCGVMAQDEAHQEPSPWLTLILGSGCLEEAGSEAIDPGQLAEAVVVQTTLPEDGYEGVASRTELMRFVESLARDRAPMSAERASHAIEVDQHAVLLAEISYRLTVIYHAVQASTAHAPQRGADDVAIVEPDSDQHDQLDEAKRLIIELTKRLSRSEPRQAAVRKVLREVRDECDEGQVQSRHVRLLAELTWSYLTHSQKSYPGWSDLLVRIALETAHSAIRPTFTALPDPEDVLKALLEGLEDGRAGAGTSDFYNKVAALLKEQARLAKEADRSDATMPAASVFVTSFDVELERVLLANEISHSIVFPVHVSQPGGSDQSSLIWLLTDVDYRSDQDTTEAIKQGGGSWSVVTSKTRLAGRGRPVIVRLAGSPLMRLPFVDKLSLMSAELDVDPNDEPVTNGERLAELGVRLDMDDPPELHHAVTIDEYSSLQLSHAEIVAAHVDGDVQASLPGDLSAGAPQAPRFWAAFGMQIEDPVIRFRVFSQVYAAVSLATHEPSTASATGLHAPRARGLAVNRRDVEPHAPLFRWLGFDTVEGRCSEFADDLDHYTEHVKATPVGSAITGTNPNYRCQLMGRRESTGGR